MDQVSTGHLIYLVVLTAMVLFWFFSDVRQSLSKSIQHAAAWILIFLGAIAAVVMWDSIEAGLFGPSQRIVIDGTPAIEIPVQADGHYYLTAELNGKIIDFVVDTGATSIVLNQKDAAEIGLDPNKLRFNGIARTANGTVATATAIVDEFEVGPFRDTAVIAQVNQGELDISLLGMTYLSRYGEITISGGKMVLTR